VFFDNQPVPWMPRRYAAIGPAPEDPRFDANGREMEDGGDLGFAFRRAARALTELWSSETDDSLALVVVYNYRHALELGMKAVIRTLVPDPRLRSGSGLDEQQQRAVNNLKTHSLKDLLQSLRELTGRMGWTVAPVVADVCGQIHDRDPGGDYFRYPDLRQRGGDGSPKLAREAPLYLDVPRFAQIADEAFVVLLVLLEAAQQELHDRLSEAGLGDAT
jgi:hypothetical protein